ncbi:mannose-6-phosphate isomerase, class I [Paenibacillus odorifer]|uniref:mannose-6-phosphate isomerase, class I n=1 Tax=Paenibacillus odorifer TaxID=189426 RepID=UPI00096F296D|nr:mannose-6-phosphate isomerase, class I [Paenibacillus odorifer]OME45439.1 mannose-6-phosphate isomerase, class I [Paenibacillus odorifer]
MNVPIFLQPVFQERIWGGTKLKDLFNYPIPNNSTGECWAISAHPNGQSIVKGGVFQGMSLGELWNSKPELFGSSSPVFPLLTKILDASDNLSVQVHPDDGYADKNENGELGKTECWYILDAEPDATIIYGHEASSKQELEYMIQSGEWEKLLRKIPVKQGDFFYVPSGTLHALGKGIVVLETQQSSDTTYRVYDYGRRDNNGNLRELHLGKAIEVTTTPQIHIPSSYVTQKYDGLYITQFVSNSYFTVEKWEITNKTKLPAHPKYSLISVIEGNGYIFIQDGKYILNKGDHLILPVDCGPYEIDGIIQLIISHE